jgi:predicted nucleic acid-binding protein
MKPTSDKYFLDSNLIVYSHTDIDQKKQKIAQVIISEKSTTISTQELQEVANVLSKKFSQSWNDILEVLIEASSNNQLHTNTKQTVQKSCRIADKYKYSFYDSLIIAAAIESGCEILYSEDLNHGQIIENRLRIVNPFS